MDSRTCDVGVILAQLAKCGNHGNHKKNSNHNNNVIEVAIILVTIVSIKTKVPVMKVRNFRALWKVHILECGFRMVQRTYVNLCALCYGLILRTFYLLAVWLREEDTGKSHIVLICAKLFMVLLLLLREGIFFVKVTWIFLRAKFWGLLEPIYSVSSLVFVPLNPLSLMWPTALSYQHDCIVAIAPTPIRGSLITFQLTLYGYNGFATSRSVSHFPAYSAFRRFTAVFTRAWKVSVK
jgi:hypothetical protein